MAGCAPGTADPSPRAPTSSMAPAIPDEWLRHDMPNLGLSVALPATWKSVLDISDADLARTNVSEEMRAAVTSAKSMKRRFEPGGDQGFIAVDAAIDGLFGASWAPDYGDDLDFEASVDRAIQTMHSTESLAPGLRRDEGSVAGLKAVTIHASRSSYGLIVADAVVSMLSAPSNQIIQISLVAGPHRLDDTFVARVFGSVTTLAGPPAGRPISNARDRPIDTFLAALGNDWWGFSGNVEAFEAYGLVDRLPIIRIVLDNVGAFRDRPSTFRAGFMEPMSPERSGTISVFAIRSTDGQAAWEALIAKLRSGGMVKVGPLTCQAFREPASSERRELAVVDGDFFVVILADTDELITEASHALGLCA